MKHRIVAAAAALALTTVVIVTATAAHAGAAQEFIVTERETNFELIPVSGPPTTEPTAPPTLGDRFLIRDDLLRGTTKVGFDNVICTVTFNDNLQCEAYFSFTGKGDIHASALLRGGAGEMSPDVFDAVIDGGTFAYANARGMIHVSNVPNSDTDTTLVFLVH